MRTKGSCRFAAYYKIQFWRADALSWQDIQKSFPTPADARAFAKGTGYEKTRVMEITDKGRNPLQ